MEATALSIGKSALNGVVSYAKSAVAVEVALQLGVQRDQEFITHELEMMQGFLEAAHDERDEDKVMKIWVKQVRDVSYNVEDCLMDFAVRLQKQSWWRIPRTLQTRHRVAKEMKELRAKVEDVSQRNIRYRLIKGSSSKSATDAGQPIIARATMSGTEEARQQREKAKVDLIQLINKKDADLLVISVWGKSIGHLEETSVIKRAYEDWEMRKKFECRAWIEMMRPFDHTKFLQNVVEQFYINALHDGGEEQKETLEVQLMKMMGMTKEDDLLHEFQSYVKQKSYLIFINDIHTISEWDFIKACFPSNNKASRIIVSTGQVGVASLCVGAENEAPEHKQLSTDKTVYAFYKKLDDMYTAEAGSCSEGVFTIINNSEQNYILGPTETLDSPILTEKGSQDRTCPAEAESRSNMMSTSSNGSEQKNTITLAESGFIGRQTDEKEVARLISSRDMEKFQVISVWGMGGIGKTTLATRIYQSEEISGSFAKRACVTIKRPFNCGDLVSSLTKQLGDLNNLATGYLVVLDDLWSITEWDAIMKYLPKTAASCIVITTRGKNIAQHCSDEESNIYKLNTLSLDDARLLFSRKVFKDTVTLDGQDPELLKEAEVILKKCGGLPLALAVVGGFLANQPKTAFEWRNFNNYISAELEMNPELGVIKAILIKSYDGLPFHLKACFLYLAIFPEDYKIPQRRLVRRWIAEGYSREVRGKSEEEILDSYFMELINRSMILPHQQSINSRKGFEACQVHDLIREIAISQSIEENLVLTLEKGCSLSNRGTVRHLVVSSNFEGGQFEFENVVDLSRLRSLTVFGEWRSLFIFDEMRLLRVLDLEDSFDLVGHHLEHIGKLVHLRYLSLKGCAGIFHLPNSFGNLRQLHTLDISDTSIIKLPRTIIKLVKLQHILASGIAERHYEIFEDADECSKLRSLTLNSVFCCVASCCVPHAFEEVIQVDDGALNRHDVCTAFCCSILPYYAAGRNRGGVEVPRGIWKLKSLQTLRTLDISAGKAVLEDIKRLTQLRKLGVVGINKRNGPGLCSAVAPLSCLESLSLRSDGKQGLSGCLDGATSHPENLQSLKLYGELVTLPEWIQGLKCLVELKLCKSRITEHDATIKVLGDLPNLATLRLLQDSFIGEEVYLNFCRERFPSLKVLQLDFIEDLSVVFDEGATPKLELLQFHGYRSEQTVGSFCGLPYLLSLNEFMLHLRNWNADFLEYLRGELAENGTVLKKYEKYELVGGSHR